MSPRLVDIDRAVETLRQEEPPADVLDRARKRIHGGPRHQHLNYRPLAVGAALILTAVVFWPTRQSSSAWGQSVASTLEAPFLIRTSRFADGTLAMKTWRAGKKEAMLLYDQKGQLICESRDDGKRRLLYFDMFAMNKGLGRSPNTVRYATTSRHFDFGRVSGVPQFESLDALLKTSGLHVVEHRLPDSSNKLETYHLVAKKPYTQDMLVGVDPGSRRIMTVTHVRNHQRVTFEYPDVIPASAFEPRVQVARGLVTYDVEAQIQAAKTTIAKGLGKSGPVTLRLVVMDYLGSLWALWTGPLPDSKLSHPIRIPGQPVMAAYGLKEFTDKYTSSRSKPIPGVGKLGGMAITPKAKLGNTVNLDVPYPGGVAHFRNVPIMRVGYLNSIDEALGTK